MTPFEKKKECHQQQNRIVVKQPQIVCLPFAIKLHNNCFLNNQMAMKKAMEMRF